MGNKEPSIGSEKLKSWWAEGIEDDAFHLTP